MNCTENTVLTGQQSTFQAKRVDFGLCSLTLYAAADGLLAIAFTGHEEKILSHIGRYFPELSFTEDENPLLDTAALQLFEYFSGKRQEFSLPLQLSGTDFMKSVYKVLLRIPYGKTKCYGDIAAEIGQPKAMRAVGLANNKNPLPIIIPCHRVNARDGQLTGYAGGLPLKKALQSLEEDAPETTGVPSESEESDAKRTAYLYSLLAKAGNPFEELRMQSEKEYIPITKEDSLALLKSILCAGRGKHASALRVLEIGTAVGYSALHFWKLGTLVTTIEREDAMAAAARLNFQKYDANITLLEGEASEILPGLSESFDFIYVDAAKGQYKALFQLCKGLCAEHGLIVFDNVLYKGLTELGSEVSHKHRTIARNLDAFLTEAVADADFVPSVVPLGDGILVLARR